MKFLLFKIQLEEPDDNQKAYNIQIIEYQHIKTAPPKKDENPQSTHCYNF